MKCGQQPLSSCFCSDVCQLPEVWILKKLPTQPITNQTRDKLEALLLNFLKCTWSERAENGFLTTFSSASVQGWSERGHWVDGEVRGQKHTQAAPTEGHHLGCHQNDALDCEFLPEDVPRLPRSSPLCSCLLWNLDGLNSRCPEFNTEKSTMWQPSFYSRGTTSDICFKWMSLTLIFLLSLAPCVSCTPPSRCGLAVAALTVPNKIPQSDPNWIWTKKSIIIFISTYSFELFDHVLRTRMLFFFFLLSIHRVGRTTTNHFHLLSPHPRNAFTFSGGGG